MSTLTAVTPDGLLNLPDSVRYELVDGQLVERNMGAESSEIAARILILLGIFLRQKPLGRLFGSDTSYQCFADDQNRVRRADVGFVRFDRLPNGLAPKGHICVAPDLAVEVISPNDISEAFEQKIVEWLAAGVPLVWVVSPSSKTVRVHRPRSSENGPISMLSADDVISGEEVLQEFTAPVREFFENV